MSNENQKLNTCNSQPNTENKSKPFLAQTNVKSKIKKVIGIVSGKGGVGKSLTTGMIATTINRLGYSTAILDGDITGPSIPKMFGIKEKARGTEKIIYPVESKTGIKIMSLNLLTENDTDPVVWRGSIVSSMITQFWSDVEWGDIDYLFIDMPPGTSDVPLTVYQSLPIDGIIIVTSPQDLVTMIVEKAANMAKMMNIPIIGLVENMSYLQCPCCNEKINLFGPSKADEVAKKLNCPLIGQIPLNQEIAKNCDDGKIELFKGDYLHDAIDIILNI